MCIMLDFGSGCASESRQRHHCGLDPFSVVLIQGRRMQEFRIAESAGIEPKTLMRQIPGCCGGIIIYVRYTRIYDSDDPVTCARFGRVSRWYSPIYKLILRPHIRIHNIHIVKYISNKHIYICVCNGWRASTYWIYIYIYVGMYIIYC